MKGTKLSFTGLVSHHQFENLVSYERYKAENSILRLQVWFENLVSYERYKAPPLSFIDAVLFENLVSYERYKAGHALCVP